LSKYNVRVIRLFVMKSVIADDQPPKITITIKSIVVTSWPPIVSLCTVV
jgi:hypothetical protein